MIVPITYKWGVMLVHLTKRDEKWRGVIKPGKAGKQYSFTVKDFKNIATAARWARGEDGGKNR